MFIKVTLRNKTGYHYSDPAANSLTFVNANKIDYYIEDSSSGYKSTICINGKEFQCTESVAEISEKINLAKIAETI